VSPDADVLVVGGGPAGSATALLLARAGRDVLLLDRARFPRAKACGECLSPGARTALARLGLDSVVQALEPARLLGWDLGTPGGPVHAARFPGEVGPGWGVDRARLDAALLQEARAAGARVREGARVTEVRPAATRNGDRTAPGRDEAHGLAGTRLARATLADGSALHAPVLVGADGLRSVVARSLGAVERSPRLRKASLSIHVEEVEAEPDRGRLLLDGRLTLGLAPLDAEGRRWTLTAVVPSSRSGALPRSGADLVRLAAGRMPELRRARTVSTPLGSGPFDWPVRRPVHDGVVLVGDAAGYFDPLTGQGIYRALRSAEIAAPAIDAALEDGRTSREALGSYRRELTAAFRAGRWLQRLIEAALGRPGLLERVLERLERTGSLADLVAVTGDARPATSLLRPDLLLRVVAGSRAPHSGLSR
jgi:geranylgeranyl reductase family protein